MAVAAITGHISLPSHSGPIVLTIVIRSMSSRARRRWRMPTPKSNPSRTKKPVQKIATMMNQTLTKDMGASLHRGGDGRLIGRLGRRRRQAAAGVPHHQDDGDDPEDQIKQEKDDEARDDRARADRG